MHFSSAIGGTKRWHIDVTSARLVDTQAPPLALSFNRTSPWPRVTRGHLIGAYAWTDPQKINPRPSVFTAHALEPGVKPADNPRGCSGKMLKSQAWISPILLSLVQLSFVVSTDTNLASKSTVHLSHSTRIHPSFFHWAVGQQRSSVGRGEDNKGGLNPISFLVQLSSSCVVEANLV